MDVEIRHSQVTQQNAAIGVGIGAHTPIAFRRQLGQFRYEPAIFIEQFFGLVALHPAFEQLDVIGMLGINQKRHLMRPERALDFQTVDDFRPVQPLGDLRTIIGQRCRAVSFSFRAFCRIRFMSFMALSRVVAMSSCIFSGSSPSTK